MYDLGIVFYFIGPIKSQKKAPRKEPRWILEIRHRSAKADKPVFTIQSCVELTESEVDLSVSRAHRTRYHPVVVAVFEEALPLIEREERESEGEEMTIVFQYKRESLRAHEASVSLTFEEMEALFRSHTFAQHKNLDRISLSRDKPIGHFGKMRIGEVSA